MTPTYKISSAPSPNFPAANDLMDRQPVFFGPNNYHQAVVAASSSYLHTRNFFYSTSGDQSEYYSNHKELQDPQIQQHQADTIALNGGSYDIENESSGNGLRFSILKKDDKYENHDQIHESTNNYQVKRMPSKIRLMLKMKNADRTAAKAPTSTTSSLKLDQEQRQPSSPKEFIDNSSKTFSSNSSNPVRVCSDCNTTKTPLWRSGPQGPKTLCNACGIRQRKARRAMAAAAAENGTTVDQTKATTPIVLKTNKTQRRDKRPTSCGHFTTKYKKHAATSSHQGKKKPCFEDFLVNLSNNLAFHRVFPQDEKDAAILLMALSCDFIHG